VCMREKDRRESVRVCDEEIERERGRKRERKGKKFLKRM